jgi:chaperonin GroEL
VEKTSKPITGPEARKKILAGVNAVYRTVAPTLGPEGRNALLPRSWNRGPRNTNDGVTISENVLLKDEHERLAADFFKEGSKKTNELVGACRALTKLGGWP